MTEKWMPIKGWEDLYEVSDQGRVRSKDRYIRETRGRTRFSKGRILKLRGQTHLYANLRDGLRLEQASVHRLVAIAFIPNPKGLTHVLHGDDNPANNRAVNLQWGDDLDNRRDALKNGRVSGGILSREDVPQIRKRVSSGEYQTDVARDLGVHPSLISRIMSGERRKND